MTAPPLRPASAPPVQSRTRYAILGLLGNEPLSGYDIKKAVEERIAHFWNESIGNVYPTLRRMTDEGLVTRSSDGASARGRAVYAITAAGRRELAAWLREPVVPSPPRLEILLKVYFGAHTEPSVLASHLAGYRSERARQLAMLQRVEQELRSTGSEATRHLRLTISAGVHAARAALAWCDEALEELSRERALEWLPRDEGPVEAADGAP